MKYWPVPDSFSHRPPTSGEHGCFWEDRGDRFHAGVDIYASQGSSVVAVEDGQVIIVQQFTSPDLLNYWNITYSILIKTSCGLVTRYAELSDIVIQSGDQIVAGQVLGKIGLVLNESQIDAAAPEYIRLLQRDGVQSMLHFELHSNFPVNESHYLGGNYFTRMKPDSLLDPVVYLSSCDKV